MKTKQQSKIGSFVLIGQSESLTTTTDETEGVFIYRSPAGRFKVYVFKGHGQFNGYDTLRSCYAASPDGVFAWLTGLEAGNRMSFTAFEACAMAGKKCPGFTTPIDSK